MTAAATLGPAATGTARPAAMVASAVRPAGSGTPALVVFTDHTDLPWLRLLRPGFRHCFAVVQANGAWVIVDPLSHCTTLQVVPELAGWQPQAWFRHHGLTVVTTEVRQPPHRLAPWRPYTCVEAVKRLLGLRLPGVFTPWQLYRALQGERKIRVEEKNLDMRRRKRA
ncbi:hypothetical protein [Caenispirillum bisanense]|uniref:hypothetical protein n=1 Tax=Caenispirillum bisanense TaxID=414052 RepID=UPI0031CDB06C